MDNQICHCVDVMMNNQIYELRTIRTLANWDLGQFGPDSDLSYG